MKKTIPYLKSKYFDQVISSMIEHFNYKNIMEVPMLTQIYDFMERLISIALPRTRDFRGLSFKSFDGRGNYSFGVKEQIIFTEIDYDKIDSVRGMDITFSTTAKSDDESYWLLKLMGLPLREKPVKKEEAEVQNG